MINNPWLQRFSRKAVLIFSPLVTAVGAKAAENTPLSHPKRTRFGQLLRTLMVGLLMLSWSAAWGQSETVTIGTGTTYAHCIAIHSCRNRPIWTHNGHRLLLPNTKCI